MAKQTDKLSRKLDIKIKEPEYARLKPNILVVGVGGAGNNAISNLVRDAQDGIDVVAMNTDAQSLDATLAPLCLQLGPDLTQGLGAGADPEVGRQAAEESQDKVLEHFSNYHICFIAAGMGGGTGTGASPVVARLSREAGLLTVAIVTMPFHFEGRKKMSIALDGQKALLEQVDTMIVIPNQNLFKLTNEQTSLPDAFRMADSVLCHGVRSITDLILRAGLKNLDFNDIRTVMSSQGLALIGSGVAEGEHRARQAAEAAITNPLLNEMSISEARNVLINITAGFDITAYEVDEINSFVRERVHEDADVHWGANIDESMQQRLRVSVIVTGLQNATSAKLGMDDHVPMRTKKPVLQKKREEIAILSDEELRVLGDTERLSAPSLGVDSLTEEEQEALSLDVASSKRDAVDRQEVPVTSREASPSPMVERYDEAPSLEIAAETSVETTAETQQNDDGGQISMFDHDAFSVEEPQDEIHEDRAHHKSTETSLSEIPEEVALEATNNSHDEVGQDREPSPEAMLPQPPDFLLQNQFPQQDQNIEASETSTDVMHEAELENASAGEERKKVRPGFLSLLSRKWGRGAIEEEQEEAAQKPIPPAKVALPEVNNTKDLLYQMDNDDLVEDHEIPAFLRQQMNQK